MLFIYQVAMQSTEITMLFDMLYKETSIEMNRIPSILRDAQQMYVLHIYKSCIMVLI